MKRLLIIIITIVYWSAIFSQKNDQRPLLCETNIITQQQYIAINRLSELDSLFKAYNTSLRFIFLSENLSLHEVDNFIESKKYKKNILALNHPIWINKREIAASKSFTILLSPKIYPNSRYVHHLYKVRNLSEKLPEKLPYQSFILFCGDRGISDTTFYSALNQFWKQNLRPVHIILTDGMENREKLKSLIEAQYRVFGTFLYQNKPISDVRINTGIKSKSGYFSLPYKRFIRILPQKPGYSFEPSCVASNFESREFERRIIAFPFKLEEKKIAEVSAANADQLQLYEVDIEDFKEKESVFSFQKPASQISLKNTSINRDCHEFSISFWIYPTSKSKYQNIISQDTVFNIKLFNGNYCFTRVGVSDYQLKNTPILFDKWSFMSFVVEQNSLTVYCNGVMTQKINITPIFLANRDFQLGNNIWDEHFRGYLGSVSIWERALSNAEVLHLYKSPTTNIGHSLLIVFSILIILLISLWLIFKRNNKKLNAIIYKQDENLDKHHTMRKETTQCRIRFIGNLHLWNNDMEDVSLMMSAKQKHLFCLLALHTFKNEIGISSIEINDTLWPAMDTKSANNNRNVYIMRLKELLLKFPEVQVTFQKKNWKIDLAPNVSCDYLEIMNIENELKEKNYKNLSLYLKLLDNGLLVNIQDVWIDKFKSNFEEERLTTLEMLLNESSEIGNYEQCIQIANAMLSLDEFNEFAFDHKIKALNNLGKKSLADKYLQSYKLRYDEVYSK